MLIIIYNRSLYIIINEQFLFISLNVTFYERNNAKIILLIIFYVFSLLLFFLYQTIILQKKEGYMNIYEQIYDYICLYILVYIFIWKIFSWDMTSLYLFQPYITKSHGKTLTQPLWFILYILYIVIPGHIIKCTDLWFSSWIAENNNYFYFYIFKLFFLFGIFN